MTQQLPVRIGYEYPAKPRKHQVPCPHRKGVGHGTFCISGAYTPLPRCNTLDFVPKSCAKGVLHPLESLLTSPVGDVDSPDRKLSQRCAGLSAARKRHFCGSVITHYDTFIPAVCKV